MHFAMAGTTAPSHIYPSLALIAELVARGHRVSYVIGDRHADLVAPTGAEVIAHPSVLPGADADWPEDPGEAMRPFLDDSIANLPRLLDVADVDAVLYDIGGLGGPVAAHRWGVPAIQLSPTYVAWDGYEDDMAEFTAALKASQSGKAYFATLREWLDAHDMADVDADAFLGRPGACVVLIPRVLQPNQERVGDRYVFAGPCIDETRTAGWTPAPGDERPLVYVSMGTAYTDLPELYARVVTELGETYRLVIATGKVDPATLPPGAEAARVQPQLDVLARADVFITHAGMGGTCESLWFGVPTVAVPQAVDQFTNAAQLEAIGAGVQLGERSLSEAVAAALACAPRARELREEVRAQGGTARAADAWLSRRAPSAGSAPGPTGTRG
jgi:MGT family glycosyltransferase